MSVLRREKLGGGTSADDERFFSCLCRRSLIRSIVTLTPGTPSTSGRYARLLRALKPCSKPPDVVRVRCETLRGTATYPMYFHPESIR